MQDEVRATRLYLLYMYVFLREKPLLPFSSPSTSFVGSSDISVRPAACVDTAKRDPQANSSREPYKRTVCRFSYTLCSTRAASVVDHAALQRRTTVLRARFSFDVKRKPV